jgi:hypothetical protein
MIHGRERGLIKDHMAREIGFVGDRVETLVSCILVAQKYAWLGPVLKLMEAIWTK